MTREGSSSRRRGARRSPKGWRAGRLKRVNGTTNGYEQVLPVGQGFFLADETKDITTAHGGWAKFMDATCITIQGIEACDSLVPASTEEILQNGGIADDADAPAARHGEGTRDCVLDF